MNKRILLAAVVALAIQFAVEWLLGRVAPDAWQVLVTPIGWLYPAAFLMTFLSMLVGGWIARSGFRRVAVVITAILAVLALAVMVRIQVPATSDSPLAIITSYLSVNGLGTLLMLALAWLGADVGQRLARRTPRDPVADAG